MRLQQLQQVDLKQTLPAVVSIAVIVICFSVILQVPIPAHTDAADSTQRLAACSSLPLPPAFVQYLNTSFLGQRQFVQAGHVNFTYYRFGPLNVQAKGRALLLVAGSGATLGIWTPDLLKTLAETRQVIIFDNRGIGLSTDSQEAEHTADSYAESTVGLINALALNQPDILGWSMGRFITLTIAVKYANMVHNVVLASSSSGGLLGTSAASAAVLEAQAPALLSGLPQPAYPIYPNTNAGNLGLCKFLASQQVMPQSLVSSEQLLGQNPAIFDYLNEPSSAIYNSLANITKPVMVIHGSRDEDVSVQDGYTVVNKVPGASFLQFADAGHGAILQHAVTVSRVVSAFLDQ